MTRDTDYGIRALCFIAKRRGKIVTVKELVECLKVPRPFLRKILQRLSTKGILMSQKGKGGGFGLVVEPQDISIYKMIKIFQGPLKLSDHTFRKNPCPELKNCILKKRLDVIEKCLERDLEAITLDSLI